MVPCSHLQCNRRTQELGFSRSVREARDLPTYAGEALKTFRIAHPDSPDCCNAVDDNSRGLPRRITRQSKGLRLPACWNLRSRMGSAPSSRLPSATVLGLGRRTQPGVVGLSAFFSLLTFLFNCEPEFASSRFDSGVSILAAAFVRPDGWIQGPLVTPEAQSSSTRWQNQVL